MKLDEIKKIITFDCNDNMHILEKILNPNLLMYRNTHFTKL